MAGREPERAAEAHPDAGQPVPRDQAGAVFAAVVLNVGRGPDAAEPSAAQLAARRAAAEVLKAWGRWALPASESAWRSAAMGSENLERNRPVDCRQAQPDASAAVEAVAAWLEVAACRAMPR